MVRSVAREAEGVEVGIVVMQYTHIYMHVDTPLHACE